MLCARSLPAPKPTGFTLVEMAVVLVIIGLLVGSVIGGKALIRNAELQAIVSDYAKYKDAAAQFKTQYSAIPGDMPDATDFWGQSTACGGTVATGVCNGNGDGQVNYAAAASGSGETYQFWRELLLAGRITTGSYSGVSGPASRTDSIPATNIPASRMSKSGWDVGYSTYIIDANYSLNYGNYFRIGAMQSGSPAIAPLLTPQEAWKIDTKLDDGIPGRGTIIGSNWGSCSTATSNTDFDKPYALSSTATACTLFFINQF